MMLKRLKRILSIRFNTPYSRKSQFKTRHSGENLSGSLVTPAKAGVQIYLYWIPAFAGMTWVRMPAFAGMTLALCLAACNQQSSITDSSGAVINLKSYEGKWLVINYWADWCTPCLQELPALNEFYKKHKKNVAVLGVNFDHLSNDKIKKFKKQYALNFPMTNNFPIENYGVKNIPNLPTTFIISPKGKLISTLIGPQNEFSLTQEINI